MKKMYTIHYCLFNDTMGCLCGYLDYETALRSFRQMQCNGNYRCACLFSPECILLDNFSKIK